MRSNAPLGNSLLPAGDTLKDCHALLHELVRLDVQQVRARQTVLSDEDGFFVPLDVREELSGLALEGRHEFGAHEVTLQYHFRFHNRFPKNPTPEVTGVQPEIPITGSGPKAQGKSFMHLGRRGSLLRNC